MNSNRFSGYTQKRMTSLSKTAFYAQKTIKYGILGFLLLIIGKLAYDLFETQWEKTHPTPLPSPTVTFGKLPQLKYPKQEFDYPGEYVLETSTGTFPQFTTQLRVFFSPFRQPNLLAFDRAKEKAAKLGFTQEPIKVNENIFRWTKDNPSGSILEMDIFTGTFKQNYDWLQEIDLFEKGSSPNMAKAEDIGKSFLKRIDSLETDLITGKTESSYLQYKGGILIPAKSLSEADFTKVEIYRQDTDNLPVITAFENQGIISLLISGTQATGKKIARVEFNYYPINLDSQATYPLKTIAQAWENLKENKAYLVSFKGNEKATIRKIYLAYYDSQEPQEYLQPIYVFEGDEDFKAILPAIDQNWIK